MSVADPAGDASRFRRSVVEGCHARRRSLLVRTCRALLVTAHTRVSGAAGTRLFGVGEDGLRCGHEGWVAAVVEFQTDYVSAFEAPAEVRHVAAVGAVPAVDGLTGIADGADVSCAAADGLRAAQPFPQQVPLQPVEVLELVHEEVAMQPATSGGEVLVGSHQARAFVQQVVEVQQPAPRLGALEVPEQLGGGIAGSRPEPPTGRPFPVFGNRQVARLGPVDLAQRCSHGDGRARPEGASAVLGELAAQCGAVGEELAFGAVVVDVVLAHLRQRDRVEGAHRSHVVDVERPQPRAQLVGGPTGERHRHGMASLHRLGGGAPRDPVREHTGLAAARASHH